MRFMYLGENHHPSFVDSVGPVLAIRLRHQDGTVTQLDPPDENGFLAGHDLGLDITDPRVIRHLQADPRFSEIG